jgi:hypothetical protein
MEKIKLSNELEYPAYGFDQNGEVLCFTVANVPDFVAFRSTLTSDNLSVIGVYSEGGVLSTIFEGYTTVIGKFGIEENEDGTINVTVYLEKPNLVMQRIAELEAEVAALKAKN